MIIVQLKGGLGNQMFQFAAAKCLAEQKNTTVKLDIESYRQDKLRSFDLQCFNIDFKIADLNEVEHLAAVNTMQRVISRITPYSKKHFYKEYHFHFDKNFFKLNPPLYMRGYFQSEKYFKKIAADIQDAFVFKPEIINSVVQLGETLKNSNSIAVHVRKGDYLNPKEKEMHGILPLEYYKNAIAEVTKLNPTAKFYIFTDSPGNLDKLFADSRFEIVSGRLSSNHFEDLYLMSNCRHNIIANSSFSWWAAWLNENPEKIVIAPKQWFDRGPKDTQDLIPSSWIRM